MHPFDEATALKDATGGWSARLYPEWSGTVTPHGGVMSALLMRAMLEVSAETELAPQMFHARFLRAPRSEAVTIAASIERAGRRTATATATLSEGDRTCVSASATFAALEDDAVAWSDSPPAVIEFDRAAPSAPVEGAPAFLAQLDLRPAIGDPPYSGGAPVTGGWVQTVPAHPLDAPFVAFLSDAWLPSPFVRLPAPGAVPTLDLTVHFLVSMRAARPAEPVIVRFASPIATAGTFIEDGELWTADGRALARSRQSALLGP